MRTIKHLSPSGLGTWVDDREEFYLKYLADIRPERTPQTAPMAVGSAFDWYVKEWLGSRIFGMKDWPGRVSFADQVEEPVRQQAKIDGNTVFEFYKSCGALADLLGQLDGATKIAFEGRIVKDLFGVRVNGVPDLRFVTPEGVTVMLDWKVNGFYSKSGISPTQGYVNLRPGGKMHDKTEILEVEGLKINVFDHFENFEETWARQLTIYNWLMNGEEATTFVAVIHQIACRPSGMRVAEHCGMVSDPYQALLRRQLVEVWEACRCYDDFIELPGRSLTESKDRCKTLDLYHFADNERPEQGQLFIPGG